MSTPLIEPRTLKGFRDFLPDRMLLRESILATARQVYRSYGFAPIDTPALELFEVLAGKGSEETDRQMYHFNDAGDRHVGMRFDLTVPLARFIAQHGPALGLPFKRYHLATVWRGESPQAGRFREFMQCDYDTIGTTSIVSDIETVLVAHDLMVALGIERFQIRVNNRKVLNGLLRRLGLADHSTVVLRAIDKLARVGAHAVGAEIVAGTGCDGLAASTVVRGLAARNEPAEATLGRLDELAGEDELGKAGAIELKQLVAGVAAAGVASGRVVIDLSIARGLDYYTGTILETFLDDLPAIGSICSGGRYDNLTQMFSKTPMPGVGASLGLDRLIAALEELGRAGTTQSPAQVLVVQFDAGMTDWYLRLAADLRRAGIPTELYPEAKKVGNQFKYADRKQIPLVIVAGPDEKAAGRVQVKKMADGSQAEIDVADGVDRLLDWIRSALAG